VQVVGSTGSLRGVRSKSFGSTAGSRVGCAFPNAAHLADRGSVRVQLSRVTVPAFSVIRGYGGLVTAVPSRPASPPGAGRVRKRSPSLRALATGISQCTANQSIYQLLGHLRGRGGGIRFCLKETWCALGTEPHPPHSKTVNFRNHFHNKH
jgi:hypothetical protein